MSLKKKTLIGLIWSGIDSVGLNVARVLITVILARILTPEDFGLLALLSVFISFSDTIVQGGFMQALIRKPSIQPEDYSTAFLFNLVISTFIYVVIFFTAPIIATFFEQSLLEPLIRVVALVIIFHALGLVQNISLRRKVDFKALSIINITSTVVSGIIAVIMALKGFGVWSLAIQILLKAVVTVLLLWIFGTWKLDIRFNKRSFLENFKFGYKVMLSNIINNLSGNLYNLVIGKYYTADSLGLFYQAKKLSSTVSGVIKKIFNDVSFPVLSSIQENESKLKRNYLRFLKTAAFISFPIMFGLIIIATPLINIFLTEKWAGAIPYFQLFCLIGMLMPLIVISGYMTLIKDRSDLYLKLELFYKAQLILALLITVGFGILAMVIGMVVQVFIQFLINLHIAGKLSGTTIWKQLKSMYMAAATSIFLAAGVYWVFNYYFTEPYILLSQIVIFLILYVAIHFFLKTEELIEMHKMIIERSINKN